MRTVFTLPRAMALVALVLLGGFAWDFAWHQRHSGGDDEAREMLRAHAGIYAGLALGLLVGAIGSARPGPARDLYAVACLAAVLGLAGHAWDVAAHADGDGSGWAHAASTLGQAGLLALCGAVYTRLRAERRARPRREPAR